MALIFGKCVLQLRLQIVKYHFSAAFFIFYHKLKNDPKKYGEIEKCVSLFTLKATFFTLYD